jgi:hypothetical protein
MKQSWKIYSSDGDFEKLSSSQAGSCAGQPGKPALRNPNFSITDIVSGQWKQSWAVRRNFTANIVSPQDKCYNKNKSTQDNLYVCTVHQ